MMLYSTIALYRLCIQYAEKESWVEDTATSSPAFPRNLSVPSACARTNDCSMCHQWSVHCTLAQTYNQQSLIVQAQEKLLWSPQRQSWDTIWPKLSTWQHPLLSQKRHPFLKPFTPREAYDYRLSGRSLPLQGKECSEGRTYLEDLYTLGAIQYYLLERLSVTPASLRLSAEPRDKLWS